MTPRRPPRRATALAGVLAAASLALSLSGCERRPRQPPVLWIVVDTLRADHLDAYGYGRPTAAALRPLVEEGVVFDHAFTPHPETTPAIASALTGLYPPHNGMRGLYLRLHDSNRTVAELLGARGYDTAAFVSSFVMIDDFNNFGQGFGLYEDRVGEREAFRENYERKAERTVALARRWLQERDSDRPWFLFLHLIDPHGPYTPPGEWAHHFRSPQQLAVAGEIPSYQQLPGVRDFNQYRDRYDSEIAYAMHELGRLLGDLEKRDEWDDALVFFTADHGESLGERGIFFKHGSDVFDENVRVPLLVKPPHRRGLHVGTRVDSAVSLVDLLPTTLELLGMPPARSSDGISLAPAFSGRALPRRSVAMWAPDPRQLSFAVVEGNAKTMLRSPRDGEAVFATFDLGRDPGERSAQPVDPRLRRRLQHQLRRWQTFELDYPVERNFLDEARRGDFVKGRLSDRERDELRRLQSLGYVQ